MSEVQTICAAVHEITHAKLHNTNGKDAIDGKDNRTEEVEAESVSFAVCAYYGIETGENSFGYIASWSDGMELKELRSSLETINRTADSLITDIDRNFAEICKKRGLDLSNEQVDTPVVPGDTVSDGKMRDTDTKLDKYPMPDKAYNADDLAQHGIYDQNFLPISKDTAAEMIDRDLTVYAVTYDGAIMAFDREEVESYQDGTVFAMLREEWEQTTDFKDAVTDRMNRQQEREKAFLDHAGDSFAIYQLKRGEEYRDLSFESFDRLAQRGLSVNKDNYNLIYTAVSPYSGDRVQALEAIFHDFNVSKPADFGGHSLSVSDIVAIRQDGVLSCHYVDSFGFQELPNFLQPGNYLKSSEMQMEDDYNMVDGVINNVPKQPTVAELEEQAKSGQPISLMDLAGAVHREKEQKKQPERPGKKPSILAKIRRPLPSSEPTKTAPEKSAEKGFTR